MTPAEMKKAVDQLAESADADIFVYSADIQQGAVEKLRKTICAKANRRKNAILFLTTAGGDPDAGYRMAACLKRSYESFSVYVFGRCKSAGTLALLGASSIVFGDFGELGPLDVQLAKRDEIMASNSGLDIFQAMAVLNNSAFECFEQCFIGLVTKSGGNISAKMAADIATQMAVGLFSPMTAQIDPERLGEVQRAVNIANAYGERLDGGNLKPNALDTLVQGYPSHGFVIDFEEASKLFHKVRRGTASENAIADAVPGIRNRIDSAVVLDLASAVGTIATKGVPNVGKKQLKRPPKGDASRGGAKLSRGPASGKRRAGDATAPEENSNAFARISGPKIVKGRNGTGRGIEIDS